MCWVPNWRNRYMIIHTCFGGDIFTWFDLSRNRFDWFLDWLVATSKCGGRVRMGLGEQPTGRWEQAHSILEPLERPLLIGYWEGIGVILMAQKRGQFGFPELTMSQSVWKNDSILTHAVICDQDIRCWLRSCNWTWMASCVPKHLQIWVNSPGRVHEFRAVRSTRSITHSISYLDLSWYFSLVFSQEASNIWLPSDEFLSIP